MVFAEYSLFWDQMQHVFTLTFEPMTSYWVWQGQHAPVSLEAV